MKNRTLTFVCLCASLFLATTDLQAQNTGIDFKRIQLKEALDQSGKENKLVFIDCYATWCGPCKQLSKEVFTRDEVGEYFNANFICLKFDMEGNGRDIHSQYKIEAYPTLLFLNQHGEVVEKVVGSRGPKELVKLAKEANDRGTDMHALNSKYDQGVVDYNVIENQLHQCEKDSASTDLLLNKYFNAVGTSQWTNGESWELIKNYVPITSTYFRYLLINEEMFHSLYGKKVVDQVILEKFRKYYVMKSNLAKLQAVDYLKSFHHPLAVKAVLKAENSRYFYELLKEPKEKDAWDNFFVTAQKLIDGFGDNETVVFKNLALELNKNEKNNISRICKSVKNTGHALAPLMAQNLKLYKAKASLKDSLLSKKDVEAVLEAANEMLTDRLVSFLEVNNLAWELLIHKNREQFLPVAQKLSLITLEDKQYYHFGTYAAICAQMNNFEEAIKYEKMALEMAQKVKRSKAQYYLDAIEKFKNRQPLY